MQKRCVHHNHSTVSSRKCPRAQVLLGYATGEQYDIQHQVHIWMAQTSQIWMFVRGQIKIGFNWDAAVWPELQFSGKLSDMMTKLQQSSEEETGTIPPQQCSRLIRSDRKHFISVIAAMTDHTGTQLARIDNTHLQLQPGASFFIQHFLILKFILIVLWVKRSTKGEFKWTLIQHSEVILQHISN